jgi:hypothetical protein
MFGNRGIAKINEGTPMFGVYFHSRSLLAIVSVCGTLSTGCGSEQKFSSTSFQKTPPDQETYEANATAITGSAERQESPSQEPQASAAPPPPAESAILPTPELPVTPPDVATLCATSPRKTRVVPVTFAATNNRQCPWSEGTNLPAKDGIVRARTEESVSLQTSEKEAICGIKVNSSQQTIRFDDELTLTFNDVVLLSSYDYSSRYTMMDGMPVYGWDGLKNAFNPGPATPFNPFCISSPNEPAPVCTVPKTQVPGLFKLNLPADISAKLSEKAILEKRATIGLIVTGDDDAADCNHSEIKLDIELEYVDVP